MDSNDKIDNIIKDIVQKVKNTGVEKIILFGSRARGDSSEISDIDLIFIAPQNNIPSTFREKMDLYLSYNQYLKPFKAEVPIDLIVYTREGFNKLIEMDSLFARDITKHGKILYEANSQGVA